MARGQSKEEKEVRLALDRAGGALNAVLEMFRSPLGVFVSMNAGRWAKIGVPYASAEGYNWTVVELPYDCGTVPGGDGARTARFVAFHPVDGNWYWIAVCDAGPASPFGTLGRETEFKLKSGGTVRGKVLFVAPDDDKPEVEAVCFVQCADGSRRAVSRAEIASAKDLGAIAGPAALIGDAYRDKKVWKEARDAETISDATYDYGTQFLYRLLDNVRVAAETVGETVTVSVIDALLGETGTED